MPPATRLFSSLILGLGMLACSVPAASHSSMPESPVASGTSGSFHSPLFAIHFFDWYRAGVPPPYAQPDINGPSWTHQVDWTARGFTLADIGVTQQYYEDQFRLIKGTGVDGILYEFYDTQFAPKPVVVEALRTTGLKIGLFYDWEIQNAGGVPVFSKNGYISPTQSNLAKLTAEINAFYDLIPDDLRLLDADGRLPIAVFGFGFDRTATRVADWDWFWSSLLRQVEIDTGHKPVFYWTSRHPTGNGDNYLGLYAGYQHFPDQIKPFQFVLDMPQAQFGHAAVTWNVDFDNLGVFRRDHLPRAIRDDPRYLQEMLWLAKNTRPDLVFIYSWNEYFEGANLMPDVDYGWTRYNLVSAMIEDVRNNARDTLPKTLIIADDYAGFWQNPAWRLMAEEQFTLYDMRRMTPQADTVLAANVDEWLLAGYDLIVVLAQYQPRIAPLLRKAADQKQVVYFGQNARDPATQALFAKEVEYPLTPTDLARQGLARARSVFSRRPPYRVTSKSVEALDPNGRVLGRLDVGDDFAIVHTANGAAILASARSDDSVAPLLLKHGSAYWYNAFSPSPLLLRALFEDVYSRPLEDSILYGNAAGAGQKTVVSPSGIVTRYNFSSPAAFIHEPLPIAFQPLPPKDLPQ